LVALILDIPKKGLRTFFKRARNIFLTSDSISVMLTTVILIILVIILLQ
jgi:hypothetical protein